MIRRKAYESCITYAAYGAFIFALTCFGPYHGWKYGLVFSVGVTLAMWLVLTFFSTPSPEDTETKSSTAKAESAAGRRAD
ncbi:MAG TPA: hypothetical protein VH206_05970 [Xanthobacteraceae bacterium]|jgi:hypothetical protein|nr:hypothetical protein [Xanthobacteraceae bacterium]